MSLSVLRGDDSEIRLLKLTHSPHKIFSTPLVTCTDPIASKHTPFCFGSPLVVGGSYLIRFEQDQTTKWKLRMQKWCSMCSFPWTFSTNALCVQVEAEARRTTAPVARWETGLDQTSGCTTNCQLIASFNDSVRVWHAWLPSISCHHEFLAGAHEFFGIVRIENLNLTIPHKLLNAMHDVGSCLRRNWKCIHQTRK